jgi:hypothetical protein
MIDCDMAAATREVTITTIMAMMISTVCMDHRDGRAVAARWMSSLIGGFMVSIEAWIATRTKVQWVRYKPRARRCRYPVQGYRVRVS